LLVGVPDGGVLVSRVLQLDDNQRQAVDKDHYVGPPIVLPLAYRELVDGQPVVLLGIIEVDGPGLGPGDRSILAAVLDGDAIHQQTMERPVAIDEGRCVDMGQLPECILDGLGWKLRVKPIKRLPEPFLKYRVSVVLIGPLGEHLPNGK
jgi:hypothetical protein